MKLTDSQIELIVTDIKKKGITSDSLQEDIVDHICCLMEGDSFKNDFQASYQTALKSLGSLRSIQRMTSEETASYGGVAVFYRCFEYLFTTLYLLLGLGCLGLPLLLLVSYVHILAFAIISPLVLSPILFFGYFICFTRINFKKFELIPFKNRILPDELVFS